MGDAAEAAFERVQPRSAPLGIKRPPMHVPSLPLRQRALPDVTAQQGFVECMGIGRDATLKIKADKVVALLQWDVMVPTHLFVFDSYRNQHYMAPIMEWYRALVEHGTAARFSNDGNLHYRLNRSNFPCEASDTPQSEEVAA